MYIYIHNICMYTNTRAFSIYIDTGHMYVYLYTYVSYIYTYTCMQSCAYAYICSCRYMLCLHICMHACMHACMDVCRQVCMYACMYVCMYVCMCIVYTYIHTCTQTRVRRSSLEDCKVQAWRLLPPGRGPLAWPLHLARVGVDAAGSKVEEL